MICFDIAFADRFKHPAEETGVLFEHNSCTCDNGGLSTGQVLTKDFFTHVEIGSSCGKLLFTCKTLGFRIHVAMGKIFECLSEQHIAWLREQKVFFVASAANGGHVNVSPKGW